MWGRLCCAGLALALAACQEAPDYRNVRLAPGTANAPMPQVTGPDAEAPLILIAFSGGGSRAAALGLGVLQGLAAESYPQGPGRTRLVDQVKVVSSVSGGSVIAGWFGYGGPARMDEIKDKFLLKDNMATLLWTGADPITWARLAFTGYTRIDALRELLDKELFQGARIGEMQGPGKPIVVLNATDMASEEVFSFTPERFDDLCSDLAQLPISIGVSASAAFPVALSPQSLRNYSYEGCSQPMPQWVTKELTKTLPRYLNIEEFKRARYAYALRNGEGAYRNEHYLHLLDGGVADNQGVHALSDVLTAPHSQSQLLYDINTGHVRRIVVIAVNARSDTDNGVGANSAVPGLLQVVGSVIGTPIDATTAYANASLQELITTLNTAVPPQAPGQPLFNRLQVYGIPIDFDQFLPSQSQMQQDVKNIGTSWTLTPKQVDEAIDAGKILLQQHPCYQRLLIELKAAPAPSDPAMVKAACPLATDAGGVAAGG